MANTKKSKGLFISAPGDGSIVEGQQEFRVVYSVDVRAEDPVHACMETIKIMWDQINSLDKPGTFPPIFQVIISSGRVITIDFGK
jgi:hypothetical protein